MRFWLVQLTLFTRALAQRTAGCKRSFFTSLLAAGALVACAHGSGSSAKSKDERSPVSSELALAMDRAGSARRTPQQADGAGSARRTPQQADAADNYMTKIAQIWNTHWALPAGIPAEEATRLHALIVVRIHTDGRIAAIEFTRPSGNALFDDSIRKAWRAIGRLPRPPRERAADILAKGLPLKIIWSKSP